MFVKKTPYSRIKLTVCIVIPTLFFCTPYSNAGVGLFWLNNPYSYIDLDASGYADISYWYPSIRHNCTTHHEMLTGEWAAAIYYDGLAEATWLTDQFQVPTWPTNSNFSTVYYNTWNNENNPVWENPYDPPNPPYDPPDKFDTGQSIIQNDKVEVTIDYEMVDLGQQGENGEGGSPLSFGSLVGADAFVYSERYVLLQTYTITNTTDSPIENLEFYQMLHGHPGNEYNAVVYSVYDDTDHPDPLEDYAPYNEVHRKEGSIYAGNFRYDITQWNNLDDPEKDEYVDHRDWIGFSSTVPPDFLENGYYEGHAAGKPPRDPDPDLTGTHWNIEDRNLNGKTYSFGEAAGAMRWSLGTLAPAGQQGDSVKLTLAIMFGAGPIQKTCQPFEPIAYWGLDEGSGTIAYDSICDNDGALIGDPEWVEGFLDGALELDGDGDYVLLSDPVGALTGDGVTISAWVKPGERMLASGAYDILSQTKISGGSFFGYVLYLDVLESGVCLPAFSLNYPDCYVRSDDGIERDEWTWVVGTNDGANLKVYVNGELKNSAVSTGRMGVYSPAYIGYLPGDAPFIGVIDCVRVLACAWDGEEGCLPYCHKDYFDWVLLGRPDCWCTPYQCDGDADGLTEGALKYRVGPADLSILIVNWKKKIDDATLNPCADIDHKSEGALKYRVGPADLGILIVNWKKKDADLLGDCAERGCGDGGRGGSPGTQLTSQEILRRLAEIWLDPEVQKSIDEENFLKVYESLKELSNQ